MNHTEDYYAKLAREKGYPARSVFKLMEIQEKYKIIRQGDAVLDIGASPGGWSLYILEVLGKTGRVTGVDLNEVTGKLQSVKQDRFQFMKGNIFDSETMQSIALMGPYTLIASDAAPSTTGDRIVDTSRSCDLARQVLAVASSSLARGGRLVIKIFQGGDEKEIADLISSSFGKMKIFKPKSSKKASMEIYLIGLEFQGKPVSV
jgi:23S rRNA (uridine2552-2'-O)-methyltransferase